jgi:hypothetical protein
MSFATSLFRGTLATIAITLSVALGAQTASAETDIYKDIRKPNGQARSMAAKLADFGACGYPGSTPVPDSAFPRFNDCMRAHGWVIGRIIPDASDAPRQQGSGSAAPRQTFDYARLKPVRVYPDPDAEGSVCKDYEPPGGITWTDCSNF